jgi:hypothetical protein
MVLIVCTHRQDRQFTSAPQQPIIGRGSEPTGGERRTIPQVSGVATEDWNYL